MINTIGIIGGGQLGRMLTDAAHRLGFKVLILDPEPNSPAGQVADGQVVGDYKDEKTILEFSKSVDVITYDIEGVSDHALELLEQSGFQVHPTSKTLSIIRDKFTQKKLLNSVGIPVADFMEVSTPADAERAGETFGYPYILKARTGGFDGRGNAKIHSPSDIEPMFRVLGTNLCAEKFIPFDRELAIVAARTVQGEIAVFPLVETVHEDHICKMTFTPANATNTIREKASLIAQKVLAAFLGAGVFAIELFLVGDDLLVNEIAPRVHNSGHFSIEACVTSQFEQHIRAITGMPLGPSEMKVPCAVMVNILGTRDGISEPRGVEEAEKIPGVTVHIYGKLQVQKKRKMGHITAVASTREEAQRNTEKALAAITL
ncbi:MAG: 5-(carboxyamino)imidazole ribonucleotide synthase [bacterium]